MSIVVGDGRGQPAGRVQRVPQLTDAAKGVWAP